MKKILLVILILLSVFSVFAKKAQVDFFKNTKPFASSREYEIEYGLFENPAFLAGRKFQFSVPVSVTAYNAGDVLANFNNTGSLKERLLDFIKTAAMKVPVGDYSIVDVNAGLYTGFKGFAFGVFASAEVDSKNQGGEIILYPSIDGSAVIGYGRDFGGEKISFDAGATLHADYSLVWDKRVSTSELESISFTKEELKDIDVLACLSADIGVSVGFFNDKLKANVALTDIRIGKIKQFDLETKKFISTVNPIEDNTEKFNLKAGLLATFKAEKSRSSLSVSADLVDILGIDFKTPKTILGHLDLRANARVLNCLKLSAALCGGDTELGLGIDVFGNEIDAIYKVVEMSEDFGQKTSDTLTLRCRIGFDRN